MAKGKKPKLTPEEKKQLKADMKLAKKLAAEEAKRQAKRDHLAREVKYGEMNRKKLEKGWRQMLLDIKLPMLRKDFKYAMNNMERIFDAKDFQVSLLLDELDQSREQYVANVKAHLDAIDNILMVYHDRLDDLKNKYVEELQNLVHSGKVDVNYVKHKQEEDEDYVNMMLFGLEMEHKNTQKVERSVYLSKLNEEEKKCLHLLQIKKSELEKVFENMWNAYKGVLTDYVEKTADRKKKYDVIQKRDSAMQNIMNQQVAKIASHFELIKKWREQQQIEKDNIDFRIEDLLKERQYFGDTFTILKHRLEKDIKTDETQLVEITVTSNDAIKELQDLVLKGEKVLRMLSICHKYETQHEKVLPFPEPYTASKTEKSRTRLSISGHGELREIESFWQKCGQADALRHTLNEEREYLRRENAVLRQKIRDYCKDNACTCKIPSTTRFGSAKTKRVKVLVRRMM